MNRVRDFLRSELEFWNEWVHDRINIAGLTVLGVMILGFATVVPPVNHFYII